MATIDLVTGASGFVGGHLAAALAARGRRVRGLARTPGRGAHLDGLEVEVMRGDLTDPGFVAAALEGVGRVFHCAANVRPWGLWADYQRDNVDATRALVEGCCARAGEVERFVLVSTVDVYGFPVAPADEEDPVAPGDFGYGRSKAMAEAEVRRLDEVGVAWTVVRPCNVFGPRGQFVAEVAEALRDRIMLLVDGGRAHAGMTYVGNLVEWILRAAQREACAGQVYNLRDQNDLSWRQYLDALADALDLPRARLALPYRVAWLAARGLSAPHALLGLSSEPLLSPAMVEMFGRTCGHSNAKALRDLGGEGMVPFDQALAASAEWYRAR